MLEKLRVFIAEQLNVDESEIGPDTSFHDDLGADSLDLYELAMNLEDEYALDIPVEELQEIDVGNLTPVDALNTIYRLQNRLKNRW